MLVVAMFIFNSSQPEGSSDTFELHNFMMEQSQSVDNSYPRRNSPRRPNPSSP